MSSSYSTVGLYSRDRYEIIGLLKISHSIKQPCSSVCLKSTRNASKIFKQCNAFAKQSGESNILIYSKLLKCHTLPKFHLPNCLPAYLPAYLPAIRPSSARCRQWRSNTGVHWGTGPTISFCGPTINILLYHVHSVHSYTYSYTLFILIYKL